MEGLDFAETIVTTKLSEANFLMRILQTDSIWETFLRHGGYTLIMCLDRCSSNTVARCFCLVLIDSLCIDANKLASSF